MPRDETALAANWRTVLVVDLVVGVAVLIAGAYLMVTGRVIWGSSAALTGAAYATLVVNRWRRWKRIRRNAGLS